jgi:hypothetical protein
MQGTRNGGASGRRGDGWGLEAQRRAKGRRKEYDAETRLRDALREQGSPNVSAMQSSMGMTQNNRNVQDLRNQVGLRNDQPPRIRSTD